MAGVRGNDHLRMATPAPNTRSPPNDEHYSVNVSCFHSRYSRIEHRSLNKPPWFSQKLLRATTACGIFFHRLFDWSLQSTLNLGCRSEVPNSSPSTCLLWVNLPHTQPAGTVTGGRTGSQADICSSSKFAKVRGIQSLSLSLSQRQDTEVYKDPSKFV